MAGPIEALKQTRWWAPTVRRYAAHVLAIKRLRCQEFRERFITFAVEVMNTPEAARDDLLEAPPDVENYAPSIHYAQYDQPIPKEMKFGTVTKRRK